MVDVVGIGAMEVPKNFKNLRKLGVRNITQYSVANVSRIPFTAFCSTFIPFFCTNRHVCRSVWPVGEAKPRFGATLVRSAHDCEPGLLLPWKHACLYNFTHTKNDFCSKPFQNLSNDMGRNLFQRNA